MTLAEKLNELDARLIVDKGKIILTKNKDDGSTDFYTLPGELYFDANPEGDEFGYFPFYEEDGQKAMYATWEEEWFDILPNGYPKYGNKNPLLMGREFVDQ